MGRRERLRSTEPEGGHRLGGCPPPAAEGLPIATLDTKLKRAAESASVGVYAV